ncbi:hypothetical protein LDO32_09365 [Luteimonas sp. Y-2-2-4F]|nr:hypothetical protein [Luteimonas sp. Y-2-2-4F]MCD9031928.1 hypothetical protein [Luteimonas sp. Y-2-2-4F]
MPQFVAIAVLLAVAFLLNVRRAATAVGDGDWGTALGSLTVGPLVVFYAVHTVLYVAGRLLRGRDRMRAYTASRTHYAAAVVALLVVVGAALGPG